MTPGKTAKLTPKRGRSSVTADMYNIEKGRKKVVKAGVCNDI